MPPGDAVALRKWVTDRSASLGTGIRRAMRLARLMAVADGRADYIGFLYQRVGTLRARLFARFSNVQLRKAICRRASRH